MFSRLHSAVFPDASRLAGAARLLPAFAVILLAACTTLPPLDSEQRIRAPLYEQRLAHLSEVDSWALEGRLAVSDDADGGSGQLSWRQEDGSCRMDFHGALGRGAWRLLADDTGAELEFADGTLHRARSIDSLVRRQVGWAVPVEALAWWVRGLAAPGRVQQRLLDEEGRLTELRQHGWDVEFARYGPVSGLGGDLSMPLRMTARQADRSVKLAIRKWKLPGADGTID